LAQSWLSNPQRAERVWLICGESDRFFPAAAILAESLPRENFIAIPGGHKWTVWSQGAEKALAAKR